MAHESAVGGDRKGNEDGLALRHSSLKSRVELFILLGVAKLRQSSLQRPARNIRGRSQALHSGINEGAVALVAVTHEVAPPPEGSSVPLGPPPKVRSTPHPLPNPAAPSMMSELGLRRLEDLVDEGREGEVGQGAALRPAHGRRADLGEARWGLEVAHVDLAGVAAVGTVRLSEVLEGLMAPGVGLDRRSVGLIEGALRRCSEKFVVGVLEVEADEPFFRACSIFRLAPTTLISHSPLTATASCRGTRVLRMAALDWRWMGFSQM